MPCPAALPTPMRHVVGCRHRFCISLRTCSVCRVVLLIGPMKPTIESLREYEQVLLRPSALSVGETWQRDDHWRVERRGLNAVRLHNLTTGHLLDVASAEVKEIESHPLAWRGHGPHAVIWLLGQPWLRGNRAGVFRRRRRLHCSALRGVS